MTNTLSSANFTEVNILLKERTQTIKNEIKMAYSKSSTCAQYRQLANGGGDDDDDDDDDYAIMTIMMTNFLPQT